MSQLIENERPAPMTAAERKRSQRERDKSRGYVEITVRVPEDRIDEVRAYCAKLKTRRPSPEEYRIAREMAAAELAAKDTTKK